MTIVVMAPEEIKLPSIGFNRPEKRRKRAPTEITNLPKIENKRPPLKVIKSDANKKEASSRKNNVTQVIESVTLPSVTHDASKESKVSSIAKVEESIAVNKIVDEAPTAAKEPIRKQKRDGEIVVRLAEADDPSYSASVHEKVARMELLWRQHEECERLRGRVLEAIGIQTAIEIRIQPALQILLDRRLEYDCFMRLCPIVSTDENESPEIAPPDDICRAFRQLFTRYSQWSLKLARVRANVQLIRGEVAVIESAQGELTKILFHKRGLLQWHAKQEKDRINSLNQRILAWAVKQ